MSILTDLREDFLRSIFTEIVALHEPTAREDSKKNPTTKPYPNFADGDSELSIALAEGVLNRVSSECVSTLPAEEAAAGTGRFAKSVEDYLSACFLRLEHLRPGNWKFTTTQRGGSISVYDQHGHPNADEQLTGENSEIATLLEKDCYIGADILVGRAPVSDEQINASEKLLGPCDRIASLTRLRERNISTDGNGEACDSSMPQILHAMISCKWTLQSDKAQTEAFNLMCKGDGRSLRAVVVTMEPLPRRIASITLGMRDIDCVYHATLYELIAAAEDDEQSDAYGFLKELVDARRLRDISDLPLDLAV